jgi:ferredoxin/flavodoxin---NADP+ reductase
MYKVLNKELLAEAMYGMDIEAPMVARKAQAGQFVIIRTDEDGERIPLTIADFNIEAGSITIVFQVVGKTTAALAKIAEGEFVQTFTGPLGRPTEIEKYGTVVCIGGGAGIAPAYPVARAMRAAGNHVISIIGSRTSDLLFYEDQISSVSDEFLLATDDGSKGKHGRVTDVLQDLVDKGTTIDRVFAVGPVPMMRAVAELTRPLDIPTIVSLNPIMVDGTGMCGACRVTVGGETRFACVDGPEFDAHQVDFRELTARQNMYRNMEQKAREQFAEEHRGECQCQ